MTTTIYALTNDRARLLQKKATVSNDENMATVIANVWKAEGWIVTTETEE